MRLVVVEDLADLNALYQVLLAGHDVVATFTRATAAQAWTGWDTVTAVVADQKMPDMTGAQLLAWLEQEHPNVRRLLVSAHHPSEADKATAHVYADKLEFVDDPNAVLGRL